MLYIWNYLKKHPQLLALDILAATLFVMVNLGLPTFLARMIDQGIVAEDESRIYFWGFVMLVTVLVGILGRFLQTYAGSRLTNKMIRDMRLDIYKQLQYYSHQEYEQIGVSSLVTRITSDAFTLMQFADQTLKFGVITPLMLLSSLVMVFVTSPSLSWNCELCYIKD